MAPLSFYTFSNPRAKLETTVAPDTYLGNLMDNNKLYITEEKLETLVKAILNDVKGNQVDTSSDEYIASLKRFFEIVDYKI